jgi:hypothetical protein
MQRRKYLAALATAGAVAVAGCGFLGGDGGPDQDSAEGTARAFLQALNDGNTDRASELLGVGSVEQFMSSGELNEWEQAPITVENTETLDEGDGTAVVELTYSVEGTSREQTVEFALTENDDGDWVVTGTRE